MKKTHQQMFYGGRVQGVGFRYSVKRIATGFEVTGWVRNLPDGRVEVHACGDVEEVTAFLAAIGESQLGGYIKETHQHDLTAESEGSATGFEIRF